MFHRRRIVTISLVALLIVGGVAILVLSLALPYMQDTRENARRSQCAKNLSQLVTAANMFHNAREGFPTLVAGPDEYTPGWGALIASYLEEGPLLELGLPGDAPQNKIILTNSRHAFWQCPSRRTGAVYDFPASFSGNLQQDLTTIMPTDYVAAHTTTDVRWSPEADGVIVNPRFPALAPGSFPTPVLTKDDITDGVEYTAMFGEKHMLPEWLGATAADESAGLDPPALLAANSPGTIRIAGEASSFGALPLAPSPNWGTAENPHAAWAFGSWHLERSLFGKADSSVSEYSTKSDPIVLRQLIRRYDSEQDITINRELPDNP